MAWEKTTGNGGGDYEERDIFKIANSKGTHDGSVLEGVFRRISKDIQGKFSVGRFLDVDKGNKKLKMWVSNDILNERLDEAIERGMKPGNLIRIEHSMQTSKDGTKEYNLYEVMFDPDTMVTGETSEEPKLTQEQAASRGQFLSEPPF